MTKYRVRQKVSPKSYCSFFSNRLEFQSEIFPTYFVILYAPNGIKYRDLIRLQY